MDLLEELRDHVIPADGAMGTELFAAGVARDRCLEELCVSEPESVRRVHAAYLAAGARLVRTNSFGGNASRLAAHRCEHRVGEINWTAAQLAREVAKPTGAFVAGSVGPCGAAPADREGVFIDQIGALLDGGVRVIVLETFSDLGEIAAALNAKHTLHHCPVVACLACRDDGRLPDGTLLAEAFARLRDAGADVVGMNCTAITPALLDALPPPDDDLPLAAFPSAGIPTERAGGLAYPISPEQFARDGLALARCGVRLIGGCCGAGPAHILALVRSLAASGIISSS